MTQRILVINPNSTETVTRDIDRALEPLRLAGGPTIACATLAEGPPGIESQLQVDSVVAPLCRLIAENDGSADAFVIACFSDPGLHAAREVTAKPVLGIAECGLLTAMTLGDRFGIIAILARSMPRHARMVRSLGLSARFAGELPVGLGVTELSQEEITRSRLLEVGKRLRDESGAAVLVLGCAGMARYRAGLEDALGLPVVDPSQAAAGMAIAAVQLGYGRGSA